ncbi:hypothetical protein N7523_008399 [Penicillium sp. IBT 18751x]|nr:hypothetical protein N7523_008399 [Penicillium sp. IBT 18751x]
MTYSKRLAQQYLENRTLPDKKSIVKAILKYVGNLSYRELSDPNQDIVASYSPTSVVARDTLRYRRSYADLPELLSLAGTTERPQTRSFVTDSICKTLAI